MSKRTQRSIRGILFGTALAVVLGAIAPFAATAQQMNPMVKEQLDRIPTGEEGVNQILEPMKTRLDLSDAQVAEVKPIVEELVAGMESGKADLESGETTIMKFMMQMNMQGEAAAKEIEQHLTEPQLAEYEAMRAEQKQRMMEERRKAMQAMMKARQDEAAVGNN